MANQTVITITHGTGPAVQTIKNTFLKATSLAIKESQSLVDFFSGAGSKSGDIYACSMDIQVNAGGAVAASGTIAFSGISTANDTILINGTTLTAVASGATNNQWNVKTTAALQAVEVIRAINASTTALVGGAVIASLTSTATVTLTAAAQVAGVITAYSGILGNAITIAKGTDAGTVMTVSGARLTGGTAIAANVYKYGT